MFAVVADWDHDFIVNKGQTVHDVVGRTNVILIFLLHVLAWLGQYQKKKKHVKFEVEITSVLH